MEKEQIFKKLRANLKNLNLDLAVLHNKEDNYYLNTKPTEINAKATFFAAVQIKKSYVAYHLMPVYYHPELVDSISPELRKKMQGKSCFNFKKIDDDLFEELDGLTKSSFDKYKALKKV